MEIIDQAWQYKMSLLPILAVYFVFEISTLVRRFTRIAYTPIYFMFFPLGHADSLYSYYFNEDDLYIGASQTPEEKRRTRKKIISISVFSMVFATVFNPAIAGIFAAYFVTASQYKEFFWFLIIIKTAMIMFSLYNVRRISFVSRSGSFPWLALIYISYILIVSRVVDVSYHWAATAVDQVGGLGLIFAIIDFVIFDFLIYIIFVALGGAAISYWMTDPDNIPEMEVFVTPELINEE
ncbi:MAG: hypothetical protein E5Y15_14900 [Mesorhizobium sp.]|nr:MAG: hypothetical protein E5Y15_14900 [Mesorhizobium sp.]